MLDPIFTEFKFDFLKTEKLPAGHALFRDVSAGDQSWRIECYPRGLRQDDHCLYVSRFLLRRGPEPPRSKSNITTVVFQAFVLGADGQSYKFRAHRSSGAESAVAAGYDSSGWRHFMRRSDLSSLRAPDGTVTLICGVLVVRDKPAVAVPASKIRDHLALLLDSGQGSDVSFLVGGETFRTHRALLAARSPVFRAELFGSMAEAAMPCITLRDIEPATFRALLHFVYTDELPPTSDDDGELETAELLQRVLAAADLYDLDRLKLIFAEKLCGGLSVKTVAVTLCYAELHGCAELKNSCLDFLTVDSNYEKVKMIGGFTELKECFPSVMDEIQAHLEMTWTKENKSSSFCTIM